MAVNRVGVLALLCGIILLGGDLEVKTVDACYLTCREGATYMTCNGSPTHLSPSCNCCFAGKRGKGCTIYYDDGSSETCI